MTVPQILSELKLYTGHFPKEAMLAAIEQREAITPELLRVVEAVAQDPAEFANRKDYMLHLFAFFLLAQFRETRAYLPIVKIFSAPGNITSDLAGDTITEGLNQIFASVYDGNPAPLRELIENKDAYEFVRNAAIESLLILEKVGKIPRADVIDYFRALFHGKLEPTPSYAWDGLIGAVADFPAPELMPEVREAYERGLASPRVATIEDIEQAIASPKPWRMEKRCLITDAIAEMQWWAAFKPATPPSRAFPKYEPKSSPANYSPPQPPFRKPKIGRNDPCPCGSGKKYKKCCGA
jgi:hypothetical protein